jgi:hypothetical protein
MNDLQKRADLAPATQDMRRFLLRYLRVLQKSHQSYSSTYFRVLGYRPAKPQKKSCIPGEIVAK